jgi:hypothetical protein
MKDVLVCLIHELDGPSYGVPKLQGLVSVMNRWVYIN